MTIDSSNDSLIIAGQAFSSRLLTGTGKFASLALMQAALKASDCAMTTMAMRRADVENPSDNLMASIPKGLKILPNTAGAKNAQEAILAAEVAREIFQTPWLKLEIHPDVKHLMPDGVETLKATEQLVKKGFIVLPYVHADPVLCRRLEEVGASAVMPLGAPIGTNQGLLMRDMLALIIESASVPVIVDAGIGAPSHASYAMEMGADAVLVNTAIATAGDPVAMAKAFAQATQAGRAAFLAKLPSVGEVGLGTSPLTDFLTTRD